MYVLKKQLDNSNDFTLKNNNDSLCATNGCILHNMYNMDNIWYHSQTARRHRYIYETEYDYQHVYRRPNNIINDQLCTSIFCCAQAQDTLYALDKPSTFGHSFVNDYMYDWLANNNGFAAPRTRTIDTLLYSVTSGSLLSIVSTDTTAIADSLSASTSNTYFMKSELSNAKAGIYAISSLVGVQYNTIYEIPNIAQDYDKGEIIANTFKTKNQFDGYTWSMSKVDNNMLSNARQYLGIYSCGNQIWLKWKDNVQYSSANDENIISSDIYKQHIVSASAATPTVQYPQIEVIDAINRGIQEPGHKSSLYTLKLKTRLLEKFAGKKVVDALHDNTKKQLFSKTFKENMKAELQNCIRKIAEKIVPADCQLFSVTIDG